jgi:hypothetical protein
MSFDLTFDDLAERSKQYDARGSVEDIDHEMRVYASLASEAKASCSGVLDRCYGMGKDEWLDIPVSGGKDPSPLFVFTHGGYWHSQRKELLRWLNLSLGYSGQWIRQWGLFTPLAIRRIKKLTCCQHSE